MKTISGWISFLLVIIVILFTLTGITTVDVGERVLVVGFGKVKETLREGFHFVNPFYSIHSFNIRNNKYETIANSASSDLQTASLSVVVNYNIDESKIAEIYTTYGNDYTGKIFIQNVQEAVKSTTAKYNASELITKRDEIKAKIKDALIEKVSNVILITDVSITNVDFSDSFDQAVENKVKAEQEALQAKANLEKSKLEAEAIKAQAEAIKNSGGSEYVQLKAIEKWNGVLPANTGGAIPFINVK